MPHSVTKKFEAALCEYTGAPYAVAVNSCTMALLIAIRAAADTEKYGFPYPDVHIEIPVRTYIGVPMSIRNAGYWPLFRDERWLGEYQLKPLKIWDSARRFTSGMYKPGNMQCVSFHTSKILGDSQGGAILLDDPEVDAYLRRARFDGRTEGVAPKDDHFDMVGYHCYISPDVSARLLWKLSVLPKHNDDLPNDDYPNLSFAEVFK